MTFTRERSRLHIMTLIAKTYERKKTNHTFHLLMTIITAGFWGFVVWIPLTMWHKFGPKKKVITKYEGEGVR